MEQHKRTRVDDIRKLITPAIIIDYRTLRDVSIWQLIYSNKNLKYYENIFKEVVNFGLANSHCYFSNCNGMLFSFHLTMSSLTVWDSTDNRCLFKESWQEVKDTGNYASKHYDATIPKDVFDRMENICNLYVKGQIPCSKCDKALYHNEIAGTFYAGSYCSDCWENGVKQAEANENYD